MQKIVAVNIAFRTDDFYKRWRLLSNEYKVDVTLIGPRSYVYKDFGIPIEFKPKEINDSNFKVRHIDMNPKWYLRYDWWDWRLVRILIEERPDVIYLIGFESRNALFISKIAMLFMRKRPIIGLFSMRGTDIPRWNKWFMFRWKFGRLWYDFINVHYPDGKRIYQNQIEYNGPIALATQIGYDKDVYYPNNYNKYKIRSKHGIDSKEFVFISAMRIESSKGLYNIIEACRVLTGVPFKYILLGDGWEMDKARELIFDYKLKDKLLLIGRVETGVPVAEYINAADCFVHVPIRTKDWVDTFPLAVVQAMGCGIPILGSNSGAVPYQLGTDYPLLIPENNNEALVKKMTEILSGNYDLNLIGKNLMHRAENSFEIRHLNKCLIHNLKKFIESSTNYIEDVANVGSWEF